MTQPTFNQLKKAFLDSGYEIRNFKRNSLEGMSLDSKHQVKRHVDSNIMGLIMPDENVIGLSSDLTIPEKVETLLHELIHLFNPDMEEEDVEDLTLEMADTLDQRDYGFLQFLVS